MLVHCSQHSGRRSEPAAVTAQAEPLLHSRMTLPASILERKSTSLSTFETMPIVLIAICAHFRSFTVWTLVAIICQLILG